MKAQVVATRYPQLDDNGDRHRRTRGEVIDVSQEEFDRGVELGSLRKPSDGPLPEPNVAAVEAEGSVPAATQPDGTPLDLPEGASTTEFRPAKTHAEADAHAAAFGITFPAKAPLGDRNVALKQVADARAAGETPVAPVSQENLADLTDAELIQRGVDYGHEEDDMTELSHDELVTFVAEAMNRQGNTEAQQHASVAEREANPDQQ